MQNYVEISQDEGLSDSLTMLLDNDKTALSCSSGTSFPTANVQIGQMCFRTDENKLYQTKDGKTWLEINDLSKSFPEHLKALESSIVNRTEVRGGVTILRGEDLPYWASGSSSTGIVALKTPLRRSNTMSMFSIRGYNYGISQGTWYLDVSFYSYASGVACCTANSYSNIPFGTYVRFAEDENYLYILLGTTSTAWSFSRIWVEQIGLHHTTPSAAKLPSNYEFSLIQDESVISVLSTQTINAEISALAVNNGVYTNNTQTITGAKTFSSAVNISSIADSSSVTTGAVIVSGGIGVAKQLRVGGAVTLGSTLAVAGKSTFTGQTTHNGGISSTTGAFNNTTDSTSLTTGALQTLGGLGVTKSANIGGSVSIGTDLNVTGKANIAGTVTSNGAIKIADSADSTSATTGALIVTGGAGFGGNVTATTFTGALKGNADTATKLATVRTINGVNFDGSANITVADSTKLPLTGGTLTGSLAVTGITHTNTSMSIDSKGYTPGTTGVRVYQDDATWNVYSGLNKTNVIAVNLDSKSITFNGAVNAPQGIAGSASSVSIVAGEANPVMETDTAESTGVSGLSLRSIYGGTAGGYPANYGNVIRVKGKADRATTELFHEWASGSSRLFARARGDVASHTWTPYREIAFKDEVLPLTGGTVAGVTTFSSSLRPTQWIDFGHSATADAQRGIVFYSTGTTKKGMLIVDTNAQMNFQQSSAYAFDNKMTITNAGGSWLTVLRGENAGVSHSQATSGSFHAWSQQRTYSGHGCAVGVLKDNFSIVYMTSDNIDASKNAATTIMAANNTTVTFSPKVTGNNGFAGALYGNADTATKLATARTIQGVSFDGSANITLPTFTTGADGLVPARSGSTTTKYLREDGTWVAPPNTNTTYQGMSDSEVAAGTGTTARLITPVALKTAITTHAPTPSVFTTDVAGLVPARSGTTSTKYLREDGTWVVPANTTYGAMSASEATTGTATTSRVITAATLKAAIVAFAPDQTTITGNAGTATTLATARTINGTSFNGSANITTANWGTSRTLMVGKSSKSVNGAANVGWTLAEIGAMPVDGGTMSGSLSVSGNVTATGNVTAYSDKRIKKNVKQIKDALTKVLTLKGVTFDRKDINAKQTGLIAQDVEAVLPEAVTRLTPSAEAKKIIKDDEVLAVSYGALAGLFVEAFKDINNKLTEQAKLIDKQGKLIENLLSKSKS